MVPTRTRKEAPRTSEAPGVIFDPTQGDEGVETPPPNDSFQASLSPPIGGRLHSFRRDWLTNNCSDNVLNIITNGYVLPFISKPNLVRALLIQSGYKALQTELALTSCIQSLPSKNAIKRVENVKSLRFYSRLFLVPKLHQRWRPVIDLSRLNTFLLVERFKMETPESIRASLIPGEWVSSIDLADAYLHIPIHSNSRKYIRFCHRSQVFQFTTLPFGLATAPQVFTMIVKEVKLMALSRGIRLHQYLDDWLIRAQSQEEAEVNTQTVVVLTQSLGWIINQEKSKLKPTQVFSFMGYEYHLDSALVKPTQERWLKLQDLILQLKSKHVLTARCLMSLIGLFASTENTVPEGCLHMRPFQFHLKEHWRFPQSLDTLLPWTETISAHLDWWLNPTNMRKGSDLHPKDHSIQLFTDTSNKGWGAHLEQTSSKGLWSDREKRLHINVLELKSVSLALQRFKDQCQNQTVLVATDNSTVVAYINKQGGTHSAEMCALLWKILTWCHHYQKWCRENSVDFSTPSVKQVSDIFMYLYQDLNRHPSTIDGYRMAIVDTLGPMGLHISQSLDLSRLLSSFHRDHPKSSRNLLKWNLSVVLNELTKAPFEPMKDTDLKHLALKTAFLLALASGKRRSGIHAWVANKYLIKANGKRLSCSLLIL